MSARDRLARGAVATATVLVGTLLAPGSAATPDAAPAPAPGPAASGRIAGANPTAAARNGWGAALWDFAMEYGEGLDDPPERGTDPQGHWLDASSGTGRAARQNGGLLLQSKYGNGAGRSEQDGDRGTTSVTMTGNAATYGRWEVRIAAWTQREPGQQYHLRFELVPAGTAPGTCAGPSITLADFTPADHAVALGARTASGRTWGRSAGGVRLGERSDFHTFAAEVERDHVAWFLDGRVVGVLRDRAAVPGVPLELRVSMIGADDREMRMTFLILDWTRGYRAEPGRQTTQGPAPTSGQDGAVTSC